MKPPLCPESDGARGDVLALVSVKPSQEFMGELRK